MHGLNEKIIAFRAKEARRDEVDDKEITGELENTYIDGRVNT